MHLFPFHNKNKLKAFSEAMNRSQAVIQFDLNGFIMDANTNFLQTMGYDLEEIQGQHHSVFVDPSYAKSDEYKKFWQKLRSGDFHVGEYKRLAKGGREVWIRASYNPLLDHKGKPYGVVKFANDVTEQKLQNAYFEGQIKAINLSQAIIEFEPDGIIITANKNFLQTMRYDLEEIQGQHHSVFVDPSYAKSDAYKEFWKNLGQGSFDTGEYKRFGKEGREVWIRASYNPIFDMKGRVIKVVKFATDVTAEKLRNADVKGQLEAINRTQAVIEFNLDGTIISANKLFLDAMGYSMEEIQGKHHRMFVDPIYAKSEEYVKFWGKLAAGNFETLVYKRIKKKWGRYLYTGQL